MLPLVLPPQAAAPLDNSLFSRLWYLFFGNLRDYAAAGTQMVQQGTHAQRLQLSPADVASGSLFVESDRSLTYQARNAGVVPGWVWVSGIYQRTQAQLAALAATLGTNDTGLLVNVTDYGHILQWTGTGWIWGPEETGSGMLVPFAVAPTGSGWRVCDGSAGVKYLKSDGTTGTVTLPNIAASAAYIKAGAAYVPAITAATAPAISAPAFHGTAMGAHQHSQSCASYGAGTFTWSNSAFGTGAPITMTGSVSVTPGSASIVPSLTSGVSAGTPAGTVDAPIATLPGDPVANFEALLYFRQ